MYDVMAAESADSLGNSPCAAQYHYISNSTAFAVSCMTSMAAGSLRSLGALARGIGPMIAASVYWCSGAATTYTIGSVILIIPAVMIYRLKT
ncbi:hypothetical protein evm_007666 [Chilo suppressalis]|nr:hypothetical protein evm_007666 [Chilo suppressalis]